MTFITPPEWFRSPTPGFSFATTTATTSLFELDLTEDGQKKGPLIRRPLQGLAPNAIDDMESDDTRPRRKGAGSSLSRSSLCVKKTKEWTIAEDPAERLLRVTVNSDDGCRLKTCRVSAIGS